MYFRQCIVCVVLERAPKNHSCNLRTLFCRAFVLNPVAVTRYDNLIRNKFPTNCDTHPVECVFQTRSKAAECQNNMSKTI